MELTRQLASNGHIRLDTEEARKNVPSVELYYEPGKYLYGLNMFHQIHCLVSAGWTPTPRGAREDADLVW